MPSKTLERAALPTLLTRSIFAALTLAAGNAQAVGSVQSDPGAKSAELAAAIGAGEKLLLRAGIFDPRAGNLLLPDIALAHGGDARFGIAQFAPNKMPSEWRISALGADVVAYLPNNAYLLRWNGAREVIAQMPETRWTGAWLPGYKFDRTLWSSNATDLVLIGFPGTNADRFSAALEKLIPGLVRISRLEDPRQPRINVRIPPGKVKQVLLEIAPIGEVMFIEAYASPQLLNDDSYGPIQANVASNTGSTADTPIWNQGITGSGQIVTVADSGLDHNHCAFVQLDKGAGVLRAFTDAVDSTPPMTAALHPDHKILGYWTQPGATAYDNNVACVNIGGVPNPTSYHGTHVVGTVLGDRGTASSPSSAGYDDSDVLNTRPGDGMAPNAQVLFQDIGDDQSGCLSGIGVLDDMFEQAHRGGARIHSNSWGGATAGVYSGFDADADRGVWNHEDMLVLFAAGNDGADPTTTGSPGNAKNVLTVGANAHGNSAGIASFSSRGPTVDGRTKPEVTAPGSGIYSAQGDNVDSGVTLDQVETSQCGSQSLSGTSMATPTVAGGAALMRQYFSDGFYPTGVRTAANQYSPSGPLMKAVLMNGTSAPSTLPNNTFGWGRIWLDSNLYFPGDDRRLRHFDVPNAAGLATGESHSYQITVPPTVPTKELRATLTWFDPPGTPAAAKALVNDLDLEVVAPDGTTTYRGNVFSADESQPNTGSADALNNTEVVRLKTAGDGTYTLRVLGSAVPGSGLEGSTRQGYALAVSHATCTSSVSAAPSAPVVQDQGLVGIALTLGSVPNATGYQIYRAPGTCAEADPSAFRLVGSSTGPNFLDSKVTGGFSYAYRVRGVDSCAEGPVSACASVQSTAACDRVPSFDIDAVVVSNDPQAGNTCGTQLSWSAGASRCPLSAGVRYNVYRSTQFDFAPGPANLIASGLTDTQYHDAAVDPLTTYFYVVRAEDLTTDGTGPANNGNESIGMRRVNVVAHGPAAPGTYADSVDLAAYMTVQSPWSISNDRASDAPLSYRSASDGSTVYLAEQCAAITTPPIVLGAGSPSLSYDARYDLEDQWDGVVVEISSDGGNTWQDLPPSPAYPSTFAQTGANPVNACGYAATHGAFGGTSGGAFNNYSSSLATFAGQTVQLRWRFSSDPATEDEGFYLDKLRITNASMPGTCTSAGVPPTAVADTATLAEDAPATDVPVMDNDTDPDGGAKSIASVTQPANGSVVITSGGVGLTYQPAANFCSPTADSFTYSLNGGSSASVAVTVTCVDDLPTAVADATTLAEDAPATDVPVLANDTDIDGGTKTIASVTQPANGSVLITGNGTGLTYQPAANFCAVAADTFTYTLNGGSSASVAVTVTCVDDAPVAIADSTTIAQNAAATAIDVLSNDTDIDGGPKTIASVTQPANGSVVITGSGAGLTYAPNAGYCSANADTFTYTLNGGASATVSVSVPCSLPNTVFANGFEQ